MQTNRRKYLDKVIYDMITEDYVSFETAKLLKEKGFNENTDKQFNSDKIVGDYNITDRSRYPEKYLDAPTLQMAMKWLREAHKIGVFPSIYAFTVGKNGSAKHVYGTAIINLETYELMTDDIMPMPTYEEATETAIKYCLENLI